MQRALLLLATLSLILAGCRPESSKVKVVNDTLYRAWVEINFGSVHGYDLGYYIVLEPGESKTVSLPKRAPITAKGESNYQSWHWHISNAVTRNGTFFLSAPEWEWFPLDTTTPPPCAKIVWEYRYLKLSRKKFEERAGHITSLTCDFTRNVCSDGVVTVTFDWKRGGVAGVSILGGSKPEWVGGQEELWKWQLCYSPPSPWNGWRCTDNFCWNAFGYGYQISSSEDLWIIRQVYTDSALKISRNDAGIGGLLALLLFLVSILVAPLFGSRNSV